MPAIAHQNKILGNISGGGSTILVTTSESALYGQTVTLTDGTTTLTGTFSNAGECEFTGVMMVGTLTATSSTASTSINVPYFGVYSMTLSFFSATITVTYPNEASCTCTGNGESYTASGSPYTFTVHGAATYRVTATIDGISKYEDVVISSDGQTASVTLEFGTINLTYANEFRGQSVTCTKGGTTITKTAPSSGNTMVFYPTETGEWSIASTYSGTPYQTSATVVSLSTAVSALLQTIPDGSTATPVNDIQLWLKCGGIFNKTYTTINQVLADTTTLLALISDNNAVDYMVRSTNWANSVCANSTAMTDIGANNYCADTLLSDATWASAIANSTYFESVLNVKVPVMTSDTAPSGTAFYDGSASNQAFYAFDGADNSTCVPNSYVGYTFTSATAVNKLSVKANANTYQLQASNDGFTTVVDIGSPFTTTTDVLVSFSFNNDTAYESYRIYATSGTKLLYTLQFYGRTSS